MANRLKNQLSPYLLQHSDNPIDWYPWCDEAFEVAKQQDKPIFLSIGYYTCHWCHVMEKQSFDDIEVARLLNEHYISIKVDKEERPDIDSIYMDVCQAFTGSGGWPLTVLMTPDKKPFFAGTYFPKHASYGRAGLIDILLTVVSKWRTQRQDLLNTANTVTDFISQTVDRPVTTATDIITRATQNLKDAYDKKNGGFGRAPKFPSPQNLLLLLEQGETQIVEHTLLSMYRGGFFDHIGYGFSRYSTDDIFLVPHFEKMLYDNALLIMAYSKCYAVTNNKLYKDIAQKIAAYVLEKLADANGGYYTAQDADSDGQEGKYYLFSPTEICNILGSDGEKFCSHFDITAKGHLDGLCVPNLIKTADYQTDMTVFTEKIKKYRDNRYELNTDKKIVCWQNALMSAALCQASQLLDNKNYLSAAQKNLEFIQKQLTTQQRLVNCYCNGKLSKYAFDQDYAYLVYALLTLYGINNDTSLLQKAKDYTVVLLTEFFDATSGGFYINSSDGEQLISRKKDIYDNAYPSANSVMSHCFKLYDSYGITDYQQQAELHRNFMLKACSVYPSGCCFFALSLINKKRVICVLKDISDKPSVVLQLKNTDYTILEKQTNQYPLLNNHTTYYICDNFTCYPPTNRYFT